MLMEVRLPSLRLAPIHHSHICEAPEGGTRIAWLVTAGIGGGRDGR